MPGRLDLTSWCPSKKQSHYRHANGVRRFGTISSCGGQRKNMHGFMKVRDMIDVVLSDEVIAVIMNES